jgi:hypothetical protein
MGVLFSQLFCSEWSNFRIERLLGPLNGFGGQERNQKKVESTPAPFGKPNPKGMRHPRASRQVKYAPPALGSRQTGQVQS